MQEKIASQYARATEKPFEPIYANLSDSQRPVKLNTNIPAALAQKTYETWLEHFERYCAKAISSRNKENPYADFAADIPCLWEAPATITEMPNWASRCGIPSSLEEFRDWKEANPNKYMGWASNK